MSENQERPPGKYSVPELERRFLLAELPTGLSQPRRIRDLYIIGTRLRLRSVEDPNDGLVLQRKLGHKRRTDETDPSVVNHTSLYLDEAEYETLSSLPGRSLVKIRWKVDANGRSGAVDVFEGELRGLLVLEMDFPTHRDMDAYVPPVWAGNEVTHIHEFSGARLATLSSGELDELLRAVSPPTA